MFGDDALSEILTFAMPYTKNQSKYKAALNAKAICISDDPVLEGWKSKEVEKAEAKKEKEVERVREENQRRKTIRERERKKLRIYIYI